MKLRYDFSAGRIYENGRLITATSLAIPKLFELLFTALIGTVNTMILSGYSADAVAASGVSGQIINFAMVFVNMAVTGAMLLVSIELGRKQYEVAERIAGSAAVLCIFLSVLIGTLSAVFSKTLIEAMNLEDAAKSEGISYLRIMSAFFWVSAMKTYFGNLLICGGYASYSMAGGVLSGILNCVFGWTVLYSGISFPLKGAAAVACASVAAQFFGLVISAFFAIVKKCPIKFCFKTNDAVKVLKLGVPGGMCSFSYNSAQIITTGFVASLGVAAVNAKVYISSIVLYTQLISLSLGGANSVIMGRYRGMMRFDKMRILFRQNLFFAVLCNTVLSLSAFVFYKKLIGIFTDDNVIFAISFSVMAADIFVEFFRAINHIAETSLNANEDVKTTFFVSAISCWIMSVCGSYVLGIKLGMGLLGFWIAFTADEALKAFVYLARWKSGKWQILKSA